MAADRGLSRLQLKPILIVAFLCLAFSTGCSQKPAAESPIALPTFTRMFTAGGKHYHYTVIGKSPAQGGTTTISTVLVPVSLTFQASAGGPGKKAEISAAGDVSKVVQSPIFQKHAFATGDTQYGDAMLRAAFYKEARANHWHTLLGQPHVTAPLDITVPAAHGYLLSSKRTGRRLGIVDQDYVEKQLFSGLAKMRVNPAELVIALTRNVDFYELGDATVCCTWGLHGVHQNPASKTLQPFILSTWLDAGVVPGYSDVQPLSQQVAAWMNDPLQGYQPNKFPAWQWPAEHGRCGGTGIGTHYRFALPTDKASGPKSTVVKTPQGDYHLENVALIPWYTRNAHPDSFQGAFSFPDTQALTAAAQPCTERHRTYPRVTARPQPNPRPNGHQLIGYWVGYSRSKTLPLQDVSPQWDVVIVAFAPPAKGSTSRLHYETPYGYTKQQFRQAIKYLQHRGKKVLLSLGGGGQVVTLNTPQDLHNFVSSVTDIVQAYGFNGVDLDLETPSLILNPGDTNFRHPTTPSVVNLIKAMHQLRRHFGPKFMIAEVPEGPQVPAGLVTYAGQFGSFLPVIYGTRNILSFVDVQNYNTPPLEGLDGNYYMPDTADYYAAMTEMLLHGFHVGGNPKAFFPPLPPQKVAVGFLVGRSKLKDIQESLRYLVTGKPFGGEYKLMRKSGYRHFDGAMFWNIQADWRQNYRFSNAVGPLLHSFPPIRR